MKERAISPIIATVILVAVTIALAVGVALWFSGIIGGAGKTEQLQIMPDSYINATSGTLYLHARNVGGIDSKIVSIKVVNTNIQGTFTLSSTTTTTTTFPIVVKMGADMWIIVTVSGVNSPGTYQVTVYTDAGNSYNQVLTAYS
ncbi:MAG: archaellin/type IV pilin N-terminal domain-containing protein [Fervidicoccaceae archaeon]